MSYEDQEVMVLRPLKLGHVLGAADRIRLPDTTLVAAYDEPGF